MALLPLDARSLHNSAYPRERNNGAVWGGAGSNLEARFGATGRWGPVTAGLEPRITRQGNADFPIVPVSHARFSPFTNPRISNIDFPQRFGDEPFSELDLGDSFLRVDTRWLSGGVSNETFWWGPAQIYPIVLSNTAPGFPHVFLKTRRTLDIWIGRIGAEAFWGRLDESEYWDADPENDHRLFAGLLGTFEPRGVPGLSIGGAAVTHQEIPPEGRSFGSYVTAPLVDVFFEGSEEPVPENNIGALYVRWAIPRTGFEVYAEWAREDRPFAALDLLFEPDWTQAYTLGFSQTLDHDDRWIRLYGELVHLGESAPGRATGKGLFTWYTHSQVGQGHTNRGQILGAWVGPGSDAQILGADVFAGWGMVGLYLERVRYDEDLYFIRWARFYGESRHDVELTGALRGLYFLPRGLEIQAELARSRRWNRMFIGLEDFAGKTRIEDNWSLSLTLRWLPDLAWEF